MNIGSVCHKAWGPTEEDGCFNSGYGFHEGKIWLRKVFRCFLELTARSFAKFGFLAGQNDHWCECLICSRNKRRERDKIAWTVKLRFHVVTFCPMPDDALPCPPNCHSPNIKCWFIQVEYPRRLLYVEIFRKCANMSKMSSNSLRIHCVRSLHFKVETVSKLELRISSDE